MRPVGVNLRVLGCGKNQRLAQCKMKLRELIFRLANSVRANILSLLAKCKANFVYAGIRKWTDYQAQTGIHN